MANTGKAVASTLSLGAGILGLTAIGVDAHHKGVNEASGFSKRKEAENISELYLSRIKGSDNSAVGNSIHKSYVDIRTKTNIFSNLYTVGGYFRGIGKIIKDRIIPLAFTAAAICGKGVIRYAGGLGLAFYGANYLFTRMFKPRQA